MIKIIHFHPNGFYAEKFVKPLYDFEIKMGFSSRIVGEKNYQNSSDRIDYTITFNLLRLIFNFFGVYLFLQRNKPDVIFSHNSTSSFIILLVSRILFVKNVIYFNHGLPYLGYKGILKFLLLNLEKANCFLATDIITVSMDMKKNLEIITNKKINIIFNGSASGMEIYKAFQNKNLKDIKSRINYKPNEKLILWVGRLNKRKGFYDLLNIWKSQFESEENYKLIMLGVSVEELRTKFKKNIKNVFPIGFVKNPTVYFEICDYLFMTSHHEGLSYTVLEAFKSKTVVIGNQINGVSELVSNNLNGFLIKNNNPKEYKEILIKCEKDKNLKQKIIKRSISKLKRYDRKKFINCYGLFLKKLLKI